MVSNYLTRKWRIVCLLFVMMLTMTRASTNLWQNPLEFFINTADLMLRHSTEAWREKDFSAYTNTFGATTTNAFSITNIPVFVSGRLVYSPAVNRLLQLAANLYDASTASPYPSVFRPILEHDFAGNIFIAGYQQVTNVTGVNDPQFSAPYDVAYLTNYGNPFVPMTLTPNDSTTTFLNVYNVPWIIGVKKGFPNFNQFIMEDVFGISRRLQLTRDTNTTPFVITGTNQLYLMNDYANVGVGFWNSYASNYHGTIIGRVLESSTMAITNDEGLRQPPLTFAVVTNFEIINWPGAGATTMWYAGNPNPPSFFTNSWQPTFLPESVYRTSAAISQPGTIGSSGIAVPGFLSTNEFLIDNVTQVFETNASGFPFPNFDESVTNRLQTFLLDFTNGIYHVVDYVHLKQRYARNLNSEIFDSSDVNSVWNTNVNSATGIPCGIQNQLWVSEGLKNVDANDGTWNMDSSALGLGTTRIAQEANFQIFLKNLPVGMATITYPETIVLLATNNYSSVVAPYSPTRYVVHYTTLEANDPLVHSLADEMAYPMTIATVFNLPAQIPSLTNLDFGQLNSAYRPWDGSPRVHNSGPFAFAPSAKDPLTINSDSWHFPTNSYSVFDWLGRVHRGTPWQTIYLKSRNVLDMPGGINLWADWTGDTFLANGKYFDAENLSPTQDWRLASLLTAYFSTNPPTQLISVNEPDTNVWLDLLNGMTAWTNSSADEFTPLTISSNSSQAAVLAAAVPSARAHLPGRAFGDAGDILSAAELSEQSPFLNTNSAANDEAYEMIPNQLLPRLRMDSRGSLNLSDGKTVVHFTGWNHHAYVIQCSTNLMDWKNVSTNSPVNGFFDFTNPADLSPQFYRTILLP